MKNNILLILAVTVISIGIIIATVLISSGGNTDSNSSRLVDPPETAPTTSASSDSTDPYSSQTETTPEPQTSAPEEVVIPDDSKDPHSTETASGIMSTAYSLIGVDFVDDSASPETGFDNSGFIYYVLRENGYITCPRGVKAQSEMGAALTYEELQPGDLAYFYDESMTEVQFGGIYCGDGIMIACLMPGTKVKEVNITTPYYTQHFYRGVSLT